MKKKLLDFIFLDLDGPILDGKLRHYNCYKDIIEKFGGDALDIDEYWNLKRNKLDRYALLELSNFQGKYDDFFNAWLEKIEEENYLNFDVLKSGIIEYLPKLKEITRNLFLVTMRNNSNNLLKQLEKLEIKDMFTKIIVCGSNNSHPKYNALKELKFKSAIIIGDTEEDTNTAKLFGIKSVGILNGLRSKKNLEADFYYEEIWNIDIDELRNSILR